MSKRVDYYSLLLNAFFILSLFLLYANRLALADLLFNINSSYSLRVKEANLPQTARQPEEPTVKAKDRAAIVYFLSDRKRVRVGQRFRLDLVLDPGGQAVNVASLKVSFATDTLAFVGADYERSAFSLFLAENVIGNSVTVVTFQPSPGIATTSNVASLEFMAIGKGHSVVSYDGEPEILANDGFGTNVYSDKSDIDLIID
jgi:hypothetical protein